MIFCANKGGGSLDGVAPCGEGYDAKSAEIAGLPRPHDARSAACLGIEIPSDTKVRVHVGVADLRYIVIPARPSNSDCLSQEQLATVRTRDNMIETALAKSLVPLV